MSLRLRSATEVNTPRATALGQRCATLDAVGDWRAIGDDLLMEALTPAGLFGKVTSKSAFLPALMCLTDRGHVARASAKVTMRDFVPRRPNLPFTLPVVLIVGTSMSAGKTMTARLAIRLLKEAGRRVIGAMLTGAGRYRDVLSMKDAGADPIFDFVDVGLPSTVGPADEYREALRTLLTMTMDAGADVVLAEAGASPLEPYNGATAMAEIESNVRCMVLCASDPYAVAEAHNQLELRNGRAVLERTEALLSIATEHGITFYLAPVSVFPGWALAVSGQGQEGIAEMRRGMSSALESFTIRTPLLAGLAEACGGSVAIESVLARFPRLRAAAGCRGMPNLQKLMRGLERLPLRID